MRTKQESHPYEFFILKPASNMFAGVMEDARYGRNRVQLQRDHKRKENKSKRTTAYEI